MVVYIGSLSHGVTSPYEAIRGEPRSSIHSTAVEKSGTSTAGAQDGPPEPKVGISSRAFALDGLLSSDPERAAAWVKQRRSIPLESIPVQWLSPEGYRIIRGDRKPADERVGGSRRPCTDWIDLLGTRPVIYEEDIDRCLTLKWRIQEMKDAVTHLEQELMQQVQRDWDDEEEGQWSQVEREWDAGVQPTTAGPDPPCSSLNGNNGEWTNSDDNRRGRRAAVQSRGRSRSNSRASSRSRSRSASRASSKGRSRKPRQRRPKSRRLRKARKANSSGYLNECSALYALAYAEPFNVALTRKKVCLPSFPSITSQKEDDYIVIPMVVGTAGVGYVAVAPCVYNDVPCVYYTNASYAGSNVIGFSVRNAGAPNLGVLTATMGGSYSWGANNPGGATPSTVTGRVVVAGIEMVCNSNPLNRQGTYYAISEPNHGDVFNGITGNTSANFSGYRQCYIREDAGQLVTLSDTVIMAEEEQFQIPNTNTNSAAFYMTAWPYMHDIRSLYGPQTGIIDTYPAPTMVVSIFGGKPGNTYLAKVKFFREYVGRPTAAMASRTEADPSGFSRVQAAAQNFSQEMAERGPSWGDRGAQVMDFLVRNEEAVVKMATTVAQLAGRSSAISGNTILGITNG